MNATLRNIFKIDEELRAAKAEIAAEHARITVQLSEIHKRQLNDVRHISDTKIRSAMEDGYREGMQRGFSIAKRDRFTETINDVQMPVHDVHAALAPGRMIARGLQVNNPYGKRAIEASIVNVVGPYGFTLQMDVREENDTPDEVANKIILDKFNDFSIPENASLSGDYSFPGITKFLYQSKRRDGEALCRQHATGKYGIQLQPLDADMLDEDFTAELTNGNVVIQGVEFDKNWKRIAYWLKGTKASVSSFFFTHTEDRERVQAGDMYHFFRRLYMRQSRGVTEFSPIAINMKGLLVWLTSSTENAISGAKLFAVMQSAKEGTQGWTGQPDKDGNKPTDGSKYMRLDGVTIPELPDGKQLNAFDPKFPHEQHDPYVKSMLRGMAVGWGTAYSTLSGDYSEANYSSERANQIDLNSLYINEQEEIKDAFLNPFFPRWLRAAALAEQFTLPSGKLLPVFSKFAKFNKGIWVGYRRPFVDPLKDAMAAIMQIDAGLTSATQVVAEKGDNIVDIYNDIADEEQLRIKKGIMLKSDVEKLLLFSNDSSNPNAERQAVARKVMMNYLKMLVAEREMSQKEEDEALLDAAQQLINTNGNGKY